MNRFYYPRTLWRYTVALADVFNDLFIYRYDRDGNIVKQIEVILTTSPVTKMQQARKVNHPSDEERYHQQLPRMDLKLVNITQDPDRAYSSNDERIWIDDALELPNGVSVYKDFQPTPYNVNFTLYIRSNSLEDLSEILENILPYFNPKIFLRIKEFSFLNIERDIPVELTSTNLDFTQDLDAEGIREVNASLDLTLEGWMYKPVTSGALVKIINSKFFIGSNAGYNPDGTPIEPTNLNIRESSQTTEGFYNLADITMSANSTSGYNIDTNKWWVQNET
jgi:hypothetical protein